ncbi:MAG: hypothetical protein ACRDNF_00755 [Streptosporangiaceae bacterium]
MNQLRSTAATVIRSTVSRRGLRGLMLAGVAAASIGTATAASASTTPASAAHAGTAVSHSIHPDGWVPTEQCLNWSGTVNYFPALTATSRKVTATVSGTLSNCNFDGTDQTYSGTVFGVLTGKATKTGATLSGHLAVTWPADASLNPTISPITLSGSASSYSFYGTPSAGAGTGQQLNGAYDKITSKGITGGTSQSILSTAPFQLEVNEG